MELSKELRKERTAAVEGNGYVLTADQYKRMKQGAVIVFGDTYNRPGRQCHAVLLAGIDLEEEVEEEPPKEKEVAHD